MRHWIRRLASHYRIYHTEGPPRLRNMGILGAGATALFYLLRFTRPTPHPFDDIELRLLTFLLYLALALEQYWPRRIKRHYIAFSYVALFFCLPFTGILVALQRGGGVPSISNLFIMSFFLVLVTDWRNTLVMAGLGTVGAISVHALTSESMVVPMDIVRQLPAYLLIMVGSGLFKRSTERIEAHQVARASQALAASIAHEMRNPLAQVRHSLLQIQRTTSDIEVHKSAATADLAARRGLQVIAMTLDEVSARAPDRRRFAVLSAAEVTRRAFDEYAFDSEELRARLRLHVREDFFFLVDETAYLHVLFNLFKNSLYYVPLRPETCVVITITRGCVEVRDNGPGIAPHLLEHLFEPFTSDKRGGSGLGLPYCRRAMHAFGGEIHCSSTLGRQTLFTLQFPVQAGRRAPGAAYGASTSLTGRQVLVAEDHPFARRVVVDHLLAMGLSVAEAAHGQEALQRLAELPRCDAVFMDIDMPGMDGLEAARAIRGGASAWRQVPIIALSAHSSPGVIDAAHEAGMNAFLTKPAEAADLRAALLDWLGDGSERAPALSKPQPTRPQPRLIEPGRLEGYLRMGALDEFLADYLPRLVQLARQIEQALAVQDLRQARQAMHALLGAAGEAGAAALHARLRAVYAGVVEHDTWPADTAWAHECRLLAEASVRALQQWRATRGQVEKEEGPGADRRASSRRATG